MELRVFTSVSSLHFRNNWTGFRPGPSTLVSYCCYTRCELWEVFAQHVASSLTWKPIDQSCLGRWGQFGESGFQESLRMSKGLSFKFQTSYTDSAWECYKNLRRNPPSLIHLQRCVEKSYPKATAANL